MNENPPPPIPQITKLTLKNFFEAILEAYQDLPMMAFVGETPMTYAQFGEQVYRVQEQLRKLGVKKKDKVALLGPSAPNWTIAFMAIATMGAVVVPVMDEFPEADVEYTIGHSDAVAVFISDSHYNSMNLPALDHIGPIFNLTDLSMFKNEPARDPHRTGLEKFRASFDKTGPLEIAPEVEEIDEDDLAEILYTSGTTGHSKGVMLTHKNLVSNVMSAPLRVAELRPGMVILAFLPLAHVFGSTGLFLTGSYGGGEIYFLTKKPSPKVLLSAMQQVKPTFIASVPLVFEKIYQKQVVPKVSDSKVLQWLVKIPATRKLVYYLIGKKVKEALGGRMECIVIGGAALTHDVEVFLHEARIPYVIGYGMSECSPYISAATVHDAKIDAVGYPFKDVSLRIDEPDPDSGIGEIWVQGPNVMKGYYKNETETRNVLTGDGWLKTGDRGYIDGDGYLFIKGRSKNVIIGQSGENIYPEAIESKLQGLPLVEEALVYELDQQLVARVYPDYSFIQRHEKNKEDEVIAADIEAMLEDIRVQINTQLPSYSKIQKIIEQRTPFIKTVSNKIRRAEYVPNYGKDKL